MTGIYNPLFFAAVYVTVSLFVLMYAPHKKEIIAGTANKAMKAADNGNCFLLDCSTE